jgi:hypothetical protein
MTIVVVVIYILEIILVVIKGLVVEGFAGEVVDCTGYDLLWMGLVI